MILDHVVGAVESIFIYSRQGGDGAALEAQQGLRSRSLSRDCVHRLRTTSSFCSPDAGGTLREAGPPGSVLWGLQQVRNNTQFALGSVLKPQLSKLFK